MYGRSVTSSKPSGLLWETVSKDFGAWGAVQLIEYLSNIHKVLAFRIKPDMVATVSALGR